MKCKRFLSMILAVVLLIGSVPSMLVSSTESETFVYSFDLMGNYPAEFTATGNFTVSDQKEKIDDLYNRKEIDWAYHSSGIIGADNKASIYRNQFAKGSGLQVYTTYHDWYYAFTLRAPASGTYDLNMNTFLITSGSAKKHSVWTESYMVKKDSLTTVEEALVEANKLKRFAPTSDAPDAYIGNVALEKDEEYVLILRETRTTRDDGHKDKLSTDNLYLKGITFTQADPPEVAKTGYNFDLLGNYPDDFTTNGKFTVEDNAGRIRNFYEKGYINWHYEGKVDGSKTGDVANEEPVAAFYQNAFSKGNGIHIYGGAGHNWIYAFRIKAPGAGYHKVTMNTWLVDSSGQKKHSIWADVYIIEASKLDNGETTLRDSLLKKNKLGDFEPTVAEPNAYIGTYDFKENTEYILIFRETLKHWQKVKEIGGTLNMYLKGLSFEYTGVPDMSGVEVGKTVYDFDAADRLTGIFTGNPALNTKFEELNRLYDLEEVNWKLEEPVASNSDKFTANGLTSYVAADDYVAFRIKSPGEGLYTLTFNHGNSGRGGIGAVYILPVSASGNIREAMDIHNRAGRVKFYNETGDVNVTDGFTTLLGTWEFGADEEYIVVVEAYAPCPYDVATAYMYFSSLVCEEGDVTEKYETGRSISPVLISDGPIATVDTCPFKATGEVNGHDYFYLPLEGKKLLVYDIDAKELVAKVDTPFTTCRGIVVDPEGIVWAVGDNSYIFRYDPFMNIGEDAYYYKRTSDEGGSKGDAGIKGSYSGQDVIYAEDGCLYFGVAMGGYFARYEISTGTFTNLGTYGGDAANWSSSPVYHEGVLFGTITGDRNGDGTMSTMLLKMDAKTGDILDTLDLSPYVSQKEVMMRGAGICGGVILIGGDQNDIKQGLAVDAETMEIIDINVPGFFLGGPTEEKDGKVYITAQASGVYVFDGATRTATKLELSEAYMLPMACHENSFITVEGNDKYPGESILSYRSGTNQPVVMNPQTDSFMVIDGLVDESHGTGNSILSMAHGLTAVDADKLYIGVFNNTACSVLDINTGKVTHKYETNGQTDTMLFYDGRLFVGNYNQGALVQINLDDKRRNVTLLSLKSQWHQSRVHSLAAGDGKVFFGSIPDWYEYGGCLAWVDLNNLEDKHVDRHVVENQSIVGIEYYDGIVYGGSCVTGGTGATPRDDLSAKIFLYDVENKQKIMEIDPREVLSDMPERIHGISGLIADPEIEKNGIVWGMCGGTLFTIKYDKTTGKVTVEEKLCFDKAEEGSGWKQTGMQIAGDYLYVNFGDKGGVRKVNLRDVSDNYRLPIAVTDIFTVAQDGNIYYCTTDNVYLYPLVTTDADWAAAKRVDDIFAELNTITLASEAAILQAQAAYDALSWTQKAMIQNLHKLQDAKIELLECKINSIGDVTLQDADLILSIKNTYNEMSVKDRSYVKNFRSVFVPALQALQALQNADAAKKVQTLINTIPGMGEITLEKEPAIREIEAAYKALSKDQMALVDATHLNNALTKIKELRQEMIEYLKQLIDAIGDVTLEDEATITEAVEILNKLTMDERADIDNNKLIAANRALVQLQKDAAASVDALIGAIGDSIDHNSKDAIEAARKAYDALTAGSKEYVTLLSVLTEAEAIYAELGLSPTTVIIIITVAAALVILGCCVAVVLVMKKKKHAANTQETSDTADAPAETDAAE